MYKPEGIFRAIQTLTQLLPTSIEKSEIVTGEEWSISGSEINEKPEYRATMLNVARHFFTVNQVKRQIGLASQYKINKFHMHLSDDQGWCLEMKKWPDLIAIGGSTKV